MARDFGDGKVEGVDFEMVPSNAKDSKGNPVLTRRFFTRSEKAARAKAKEEPKPAPKAAPKAAPKPKPKAEPKPATKPATRSTPAPLTNSGNPQYDRSGPAGGKPRSTPAPLTNSGNPQYNRSTRSTTAPPGFQDIGMAQYGYGEGQIDPRLYTAEYFTRRRRGLPVLRRGLTNPQYDQPGPAGGKPRSTPATLTNSGNPQYAKGGKVAKKPAVKKPAAKKPKGK